MSTQLPLTYPNKFYYTITTFDPIMTTSFSVRLSGGVTLVGVLCIIGSILLEYAEGVEGQYWKLFWAGIGITGLGIFLVLKTGGSSN